MSLENRILDMVAVQRDRAQTSQGYPFKTFDEMALESVAKRWLIKGIFARGESSAWIAPPGGLKSALMASAAIHASSRQDWFGHRNKGESAPGVVYFAFERADLVRRRLQAHGLRQGLKGLPIAVVSTAFDLTKPDSFKRVVDTIRDVERQFGCPVGMGIFDTFAKLISNGGGDENSARDQGLVFASLQRVKNIADIHVAIVGHTGKDEGRGMRGSNAALGDVDVMVGISGDDIRTATVTKANDAPEGPLFSFKSEVHEFGHDEDGDPITVNVVSSEAVPAQSPHLQEPRLTPNERTLFAMLRKAGPAGLTLEEWNAQARVEDIGTRRKATLTDIHNSLLDKKLVRNYGDRWHAADG